jgi:hypothetical protein
LADYVLQQQAEMEEKERAGKPTTPTGGLVWSTATELPELVAAGALSCHSFSLLLCLPLVQ